MLESRLGHLNGNLDGLFEQLLGQLDPVHRASAANYLQFERHWQSNIDGFDNLTILHFAFGCEPELGQRIQDHLLSEQPGLAAKASVDDLVQRLDDLQVSLNARCACLFEITNDYDHNKQQTSKYSWLQEINSRPVKKSLAQQCYLLQVCFHLLALEYLPPSVKLFTQPAFPHRHFELISG